MSRPDPQGAHLRRAARVTLVGFPLFALFYGPLDMSAAAAPALFAVLSLGSYADFGGRPERRALRYLITGAVGLVMLQLGALSADDLALAVAATAAIGFVTVLLGALGGPFYQARFPVIVAFLLAVSSPTPPGASTDRLVGWGTGVVCIALAAIVLWPAPIEHPVRSLVSATCQRCAAFVRSRWLAEGRSVDHELGELLNRLRAESGSAHLNPGALAHDERALSHAAHDVERLASHLLCAEPTVVEPTDRALVDSIASLLERAGDLLAEPDDGDDALAAQLEELRARADERRRELEQSLAATAGTALAVDTIERERRSARLTSVVRLSGEIARTVGSLRSRELDELTRDLSADDDDRPASTIGSSLDPRSLWFREAVRYAVALAISVYLSKGVVSDAHSFWIPLGTYSVLRGSLSMTTRTVSSTLVGTLIGFAASSATVALAADRQWLLWSVLPVALFLAASAGRFRAEVGAASFTLVVVVLFSIVAPAGQSTGWIRLQDVAIGAAVSFLVALVLWPRLGAGPSRQLADVAEHAASGLEGSVQRWSRRHGGASVDGPAEPALAVTTELDRLLDTLGTSAPATVPTTARAALVAAIDEASVVTSVLLGASRGPETLLVAAVDASTASMLAEAADADVGAAVGALRAVAARLRGASGESPPPPSALSRLATDGLRQAEPGRLPVEIAPALRLAIGLGQVHRLAGSVPAIRFGQ